MSRSIRRRDLLASALTAATAGALSGESILAYENGEVRRGPNGVNGCHFENWSLRRF